MKKVFIGISFTAMLLLISCRTGVMARQDVNAAIRNAISISEQQALMMARVLESEKEKLPRSTDRNQQLRTSPSGWWTSGFFPGVLWYVFEVTGNPEARKYAEEYTSRVEKEKYNKGDHDVGFMLNCSFGNGYRLTGNEHYKKVLLQGAESLSTRFRSATGLIRSWDWNKKVWNYPVIIDNMMNLELMEWASKHSDSTKYANIARSHADKTMEHHFRPDYGTWHVVSYDPLTGLPEKKQTRQGYADESTWSRGQAWALYGYVMMYRESKDIRYLKQAENIAGFILNHPNLPKDKIPYWDFNAPDIPHAKRDASAGAIMASAFIELSQMTKGHKSKAYLSVAITQLLTLSSPEYLAEPGTNANFILKHSVGSLPEDSEVDVPLTYADYYFMEALIRYKKIK